MQKVTGFLRLYEKTDLSCEFTRIWTWKKIIYIVNYFHQGDKMGDMVADELNTVP